ncbi:MAG TPA: ATP-binding protein [Candidatus Binatia bacterium]|nr:ATP-binding protein [Candidatus Binatia bacterium]
MSHGRILHLEDNANDAYLIGHWLGGGGIDADIELVGNADSYRDALVTGDFDLILADSSIPGMAPLEALHLARQFLPETPFVCLSGAAEESSVKTMLTAGAADYVLKDHEWRLIAVAQRELRAAQKNREHRAVTAQVEATLRLTAAVQELSQATDVETIAAIVRTAARGITGADGATFVLREGDQCHYVDEDAIAPLWKGQRFPMSSCISGWCMLSGEPAMIEDVYADARIPADVYRPTFVRSLLMVPVGRRDPLGAIGGYWATRHSCDARQIELVQALAAATALSVDNLRARGDLEQRLQTSTHQLVATNRELETLLQSVTHHVREPLQRLLRQASTDGDSAATAHETAVEIDRRLDALVQLVHISTCQLHAVPVDLAVLARIHLDGLRERDPHRVTHVQVEPALPVTGDSKLLQIMLQNLLDNAWKYTSRTAQASIEVGCETQYDGTKAYFVRDNGTGFDMKDAGALFTPFRSLHNDDDREGEGVGLAAVRRIVHRHGGKLWARATHGRGATFYFTLADCPPQHPARG